MSEGPPPPIDPENAAPGAAKGPKNPLTGEPAPLPLTERPTGEKHLWTPEEARALASKGGQTKSPAKRVASALAARKWCDAKCPIFKSCPVQRLSDLQYGGRCALKEQPLGLQHKVLACFAKGKEEALEGIGTTISEMLHAKERMIIAAKGDPALWMDLNERYFETQARYHQLAFGSMDKPTINLALQVNVARAEEEARLTVAWEGMTDDEKQRARDTLKSFARSLPKDATF